MLTPADLDRHPRDPRQAARHLRELGVATWPLSQQANRCTQLAERDLPAPFTGLTIAHLAGIDPAAAVWVRDGRSPEALTEGGTGSSGVLVLDREGPARWYPRAQARWIPREVPGWDAGQWDLSGGGDAVESPVTPLLHSAFVLRAAEILGLVRAVRSVALGHALMRIQFGRPIGSFQLIQDKLIHLDQRLEAGIGLLDWALASDLRESRLLMAFASDLALQAVHEGHQILAAQGYDREHPLGRLTRRLLAAAHAGGLAAHHLASLDCSPTG